MIFAQQGGGFEIPPIDTGVAAIVGAIIAGIVAYIGHRVARAKVNTESQSAQMTGFKELTDSLQAQIGELKEDVKGLHKEVEELRGRNSGLLQENLELKAEVHTRGEVVKGFTAWLELWEQWMSEIGEKLNVNPPPGYTWQMRQHLASVREKAEEIVEEDGEKK